MKDKESYQQPFLILYDMTSQYQAKNTSSLVSLLNDIQHFFMEWLDRLINEEGLQLNPDFQRGHVWTEDQQVKFLEFILRGGKTGRTPFHHVFPRHIDLI